MQLEKTGMWTVRCIINGKRVSKSTGTKDHDEAVRFLKKFLAPYVPGDAERTYHNIQAAVATAKQLEEMEEDRRPQMTLDKVWEAYDRSLMRRDLTKTTLDSKRQVWNHFKDFLNDTYPEVMELRRVERKHAEAYLNLLRDGHSALTYNGRLCVLREIHRVVMEEARAKTNPWDGFKTRPDDSHTRRELTIEELSRVINLASREGVRVAAPLRHRDVHGPASQRLLHPHVVGGGRREVHHPADSGEDQEVPEGEAGHHSDPQDARRPPRADAD